MKLLCAVFVVVTVLSASDPHVAQQAAVTPRLTVPKGAVESEPGTFHYTDAQGKKWIYRQTPFGVARLPGVPGNAVPENAVPHNAAADNAAPGSKPVPAADLYPGIKASADGDTIRFERPGPFGVYKWTRNKSELDEMERTVWNRQLAKTAAQ
jgi:hypothetical protein